MSNFSLTGKTVIVTGGAGGLGRAMVTAYAQAGANVVVASRNQEKIEAEAAKIREKGQSALAIAVDISNEEQVDNLIAQTVDAFGTLDVMQVVGDAATLLKTPRLMNGAMSSIKTSPGCSFRACMWAKHNINVNRILPGLIATDELKGYGIIPSATDKHGNVVPRLQRTPNPENVADLALFLASPASDALTGALYPIRAWLKSERFWQ